MSFFDKIYQNVYLVNICTLIIYLKDDQVAPITSNYLLYLSIIFYLPAYADNIVINKPFVL